MMDQRLALGACTPKSPPPPPPNPDPVDRRADLRNTATIASSPRQAAAGSVSTTEQLAFAAALTLVLQTCAS